MTKTPLPDTPGWNAYFEDDKVDPRYVDNAFNEDDDCGQTEIEYPADPIVEEVLNRIKTRADAGMVKYGTSMMRTDVDDIGWCQHAIEELLDAALYLTRLKRDLQCRNSSKKSL